uniref:Uncharacterized protein n=1 Tax=Sphaerodactylus townsendi TaxID=933632 RepID=A0ACB8E5R7_9SAUR
MESGSHLENTFPVCAESIAVDLHVRAHLDEEKGKLVRVPIEVHLEALPRSGQRHQLMTGGRCGPPNRAHVVGSESGVVSPQV